MTTNSANHFIVKLTLSVDVKRGELIVVIIKIQELHVLREELKNVKRKLKLSEEAQKAARRTEEDYEVVLRQLEDKFGRVCGSLFSSLNHPR